MTRLNRLREWGHHIAMQTSPFAFNVSKTFPIQPRFQELLRRAADQVVAGKFRYLRSPTPLGRRPCRWHRTCAPSTARRAGQAVDHLNDHDGRVLADQRPIVRSEPVIPLETAEFDSDGLADARQ